MTLYPRMAIVEQEFPRPRVEAVGRRVQECLGGGIPAALLRGKRIAVTVGSRGIAELEAIVRAVVRTLREAGAEPFLVPAMGSHGGGVAEEQTKILADYGVTPDRVGAPVRSSLETVCLGKTVDGLPVFMDRNAWEADGIVVLNRIKPHTDFSGTVESGLLKMMVVGLGKVDGARMFHGRTIAYPHDQMILSISRVILASGKILGGLAILENAYHEVAGIEWVPPTGMVEREKQLLLRAKELMPSLPIAKADILIVDRIGKNISGVGMDPNITGRWYRIHSRWQKTPDITRIVVLDLTEESLGNAAGIGLADFCSRRVVEKMDRPATYLNSVTSLNTVAANIPLYYDTDREMMEQVFLSLGGVDRGNVRILRIRDTLQVNRFEASEALWPDLRSHPRVTAIGKPRDLAFDESGNLLPGLISLND
ncbi:MAG TPA: lactate racemase domain-containing protein [bacterium]|nr:lactate racemase domain-containing protein [bacterium]